MTKIRCVYVHESLVLVRFWITKAYFMFCFQGFLIVLVALTALFGCVWLREQLVIGGEPDWLTDGGDTGREEAPVVGDGAVPHQLAVAAPDAAPAGDVGGGQVNHSKLQKCRFTLARVHMCNMPLKTPLLCFALIRMLCNPLDAYVCILSCTLLNQRVCYFDASIKYGAVDSILVYLIGYVFLSDS